MDIKFLEGWHTCKYIFDNCEIEEREKLGIRKVPSSQVSRKLCLTSRSDRNTPDVGEQDILRGGETGPEFGSQT